MFGKKLFEIEKPETQSSNFAKNENQTAGMFLRFYMLIHMFTAVANFISLALARKNIRLVY